MAATLQHARAQDTILNSRGMLHAAERGAGGDDADPRSAIRMETRETQERCNRMVENGQLYAFFWRVYKLG